MILVIAEKPSMGRDIAKAIGLAGGARTDGYVEAQNDHIVTWCIGHLLQQSAPEAYGAEYASWDVAKLPIVPSDWKMEGNPKTAGQLNIIGKLLKKATMVINAGDAAREGQLIVDEVLDHFGFKGQVKRLWLHELNTPAIKKALAAMKDNKAHRNLYESALVRQRADWLMGMNLTRGYTTAWKSRGNGGVLHVGRVQTPTLCMIVDRDLEIENFVPKNFYVLRARMNHANGEFMSTWQPPEGADCVGPDGRINRKDAIDAVSAKVKGKTAAVTEHETKAKQQQPWLPFSLGGLQKAANRALGLSPSETLEIAQSLYETHKLTSYPRTDYSHLPEGEHGMSKDIIDAARSCFGSAWDFPGTPDFALKSPAWDSSKIGDHHGIRPTMVRDYDLSKLSSKELAVYRMVVRQFLAQFYPPYKYDATGVTLVVEGETFKASGTVEKSAGWKVLFRKDGLDDEALSEGEDGESVSLPPMSKGDACLVADAIVESKKTSPPPRFNGASLIDAMERAHLFVSDERIKKVLKETGIGTPATRAAIVENLVSRGYVDEQGKGKKRFYVSTPRGRALHGAMPNELRKPDLTAYFEELLKQVEAGTLAMDDFFGSQVKFVTKLVDDIKSGNAAARIPKDLVPPDEKKAGGKGKSAPKPKKAGKGEKACPECGSAMRERTSPKGKFWGCSGYPICKKTLPFEEKETA